MVVVEPAPRGDPRIVVIENPLESLDVSIGDVVEGLRITILEFELLLQVSIE